MRTRMLLLAVTLVASVLAGGLPKGIVCDADSDCFYVPASVAKAGGRVPTLLVLHCNGAVPKDLDTFRLVADSLGWVEATCHATRNHRSGDSNDVDIVHTIHKLLTRYPVDSNRLFVYGYSGQGVQALATMFRHPDLVRGVVAVCPHAAAVPLAVWDELQGHLAYLVTRKQDWNRADNETMYRLFNDNGVQTQLLTTPGEHGNGPATEVLAGCRWLKQALGTQTGN
ncbi:MAG TPA: prolyl oligopeptidase family serine peptidase [bacterium]|nr:prolyl oligopeptidase family serine peptidase [bacterium]